MESIVIKETIRVGFGSFHERKKIRDDRFVDWSKLTRDSSLAKNENNDCVVLSFMIALGLTYESAHEFVKTNLNRKNKKGTYTNIYLKNILGKSKNRLKIKYFGHTNGKQPCGVPSNKVIKNGNSNYTVKTFTEQHDKGRYVLIVKGHAIALVDGVLYGNSVEQYKGFRRLINYVIEMV